MMETKAPQLKMVRRSLDALPEAIPPAGYSLRHYRPGDAQALGFFEVGNSTFFFIGTPMYVSGASSAGMWMTSEWNRLLKGL